MAVCKSFSRDYLEQVGYIFFFFFNLRSRQLNRDTAYEQYRGWKNKLSYFFIKIEILSPQKKP